MTPFKSIVAATDLSAPATNAVRRAALLAREHGARLRIVHVVGAASASRIRDWIPPVVDLEGKAADAQQQLDELAATLALADGDAVSTQVRIGDVVDELQDAAARADLLVIGQRRRSRLVEWVLGTTARRLVERCRRQTLVVRRTAEGGYARLVVPIDMTPASNVAVVAAAALAPGGELHVFHALDSERDAPAQADDAADHVRRERLARHDAGLLARMRRGVARLGMDTRAITFAIDRDGMGNATLRYATALRADLLVVTKQPRSQGAASVHGSVNHLLARTRCDMLIVPGGAPDSHSLRIASPMRSLEPAAALGVRGAGPDR